MNPRALVVIIIIVLSACGAKTDENTQAGNKDSLPDTVPLAEEQALPAATPVSWAGLDTSVNKKRVIVEGYLRLPNSMYMSGTSIQVDLYERPNQTAGNKIVCELPIGITENKAIKLREKYRTEDFKLISDDGEEFRGEGAYVRLTGTISIYENGYGILHDITDIERLPAVPANYNNKDIPELDLEHPAKYDKKLVYAVGELDPGLYLNTYNNMYCFTLKGPEKADSSYLFAYIIIGHGSNQMKPVPENYSNKDIDIRDASGGVFPIHKKVKVFGTFLKSPFDKHSGSLFVEHIFVRK